MKKTILTLLILFIPNLFFGQKFEKNIFDSLIGIKTYDKELRIRTEISVINEYKLTRIYQDSLQNWYLEKYFSNGNRNKYVVLVEEDEIDGTITKDSLYLNNTRKIIIKKLGKKFYKTWLELLTTNILELPSLKKIEYKIRTKKVVKENEEYEIIEEVVIPPNDGISYIIEIKDQNKFNRVEIDNPDFYINRYPNIDEFKYLDIFLKLVEKNIKVYN